MSLTESINTIIEDHSDKGNTEESIGAMIRDVVATDGIRGAIYKRGVMQVETTELKIMPLFNVNPGYLHKEEE